MEPIANCPYWSSELYSSEIAKDYMSFSGETFKDSYYIQANIAAYLPNTFDSNSKILEIGCGPGDLSIALAAICPDSKFDLLDHSEHMLELAKNNFRRLKLEKISAKFFLGNAMSLPFSSNQYNLVVSKFMLRHADNQKKVLLEALRVLKPGGYVYFTDVIKPSEDEYDLLVNSAPGKHGPHFIKAAFDSAMTKDSFIYLVKECGFQNVQVLFGGLGGFNYKSRQLVDLVKNGFPLRKLVNYVDKSSQWDKMMAKYCAHIYIRK